MRIFLITSLLFLSACYNPAEWREHEKSRPHFISRKNSVKTSRADYKKKTADKFYYREHRVVQGDSLNSLSRRYYGAVSQEYILIMKKANPEIRKTGPKSGQLLLIPLLKSRAHEHIVKKGETLWNIAKLYYGKSTAKRVSWIKEHNPGIGLKLFVGQKLVIPPPGSE